MRVSDGLLASLDASLVEKMRLDLIDARAEVARLSEQVNQGDLRMMCLQAERDALRAGRTT